MQVREILGPPCGHARRLLDAQAGVLDARIRELTALRHEVERLRDRARGLDLAAGGDAVVCHVTPTG